MSLELPKISERDRIHRVCERIAEHINSRGRDAIASAYESILPLALEKAPQIPSIVVRQSDLYEKREFLDAVLKENRDKSQTEWPKSPTIEQEFWMDRFSALLGGIVANGFVPKAHQEAIEKGVLHRIQQRWLSDQRMEDQYRSRGEIFFPPALERYAWRIEVPPETLSAESHKFKTAFKTYSRARSEILDDILLYLEKSKKEKSWKKALALEGIAERNASVILRDADSVEVSVREWLRDRFAPNPRKLSASIDPASSYATKPSSGISASYSIMLAGAAIGAASIYALNR